MEIFHPGVTKRYSFHGLVTVVRENRRTKPAPRGRDLEPMHTLEVRVYYEDTDFSGAVYHANYLRFMERARTEMLRARGVDQGASFKGDAAETFGFVVRDMSIEWFKPARMDDLLTVETRVERIGAATLRLAHKIVRDTETLVSASVRIACVIDGKAARIPSGLRERLGEG
jgi:acyl-CoA thioester hydrolase